MLSVFEFSPNADGRFLKLFKKIHGKQIFFLKKIKRLPWKIKTMQNFILKTFEKHPYRILFILFLISFSIRFLWADFYKALYIYPDELRYYQIAENFANARGLLVYNLPIDFQKILYSICLIPAFFFENRETQQHLLAAINALLVTSSIFPIYFIAKQLLKENKTILFVCAFSLFLPDLNFSMTFMSENLFLPLSLLLFAAFLKIILNQEKQKTPFLILLGILNYLIYLNKEIGILFPLSFLAYGIVQYFWDKNLNIFKKHLKSFAIIFGIFMLCFFSLKNTLFLGLGNSYSGQTGFAAAFELLGNKTIGFFFFSAFYFVLHVVMASAFFTAIFPILYFKNLSPNNQKALIFLIILIFSSAFTIAYTVFIREITDVISQETPRAMIRYTVFIPTVFLVVFLSLFENKILSNKKHFIVYTFFVAIILIFYQVVEGLAIDSPILLPLIKGVFFTKENFYIFKFVFLVATCFVFFIFYKNSKKGIAFVFSLVFISYVLCNFLLYQQFIKDYFVNEEEKAETAIIEKLIKENPNKTFLIGLRDWADKNTHLSDTFFNYPNVISTYANHIVEMIPEDQELLFEHIGFQKNWGKNDPNYKLDLPENYYPIKNNIDYFIFPKIMEYGVEELPNGEIKTGKFSVLALKGAVPFTDFNGRIFSIFNNQKPNVFPIFAWIPNEKNPR